MALPRLTAEEATMADSPVKVTPEIAAEAAVWVARLHGPDRSRSMELECLAWQAGSAGRREAFERCTETWQDVSRVTLANAFAAASRSALPPARPSAWRTARAGWAIALGIAVLVGAGLVFVPHVRDTGTFSTRVGEQRVVLLDDGTRMSLNTDTGVRVALSSTRRLVNVLGGEAIFEVAKDADRPFVVRMGDTEVVAVGTVFSVRFTGGARASEALAVTLIEGRVSVQPSPDTRADGIGSAQPLLLKPGERVRFGREAGGKTAIAAPLVDRPVVEQVIAWTRNEVVFDDVSLSDAVAEMNRYSRTPIELVDGTVLSNRRVSGQFRAGENVDFARAVAALHGLVVKEHAGRLRLAIPP